MLILVTGGAASGKSEYAEKIITAGENPLRIYLATMRVFDGESQKRVARHRSMREGKGFQTIERCLDLAGVSVAPGGDILLECMSNLVANEMFEKGGAGDDTVSAVLKGVSLLEKQSQRLVVVSNEIFSDGRSYDIMTMCYIKALGEMNAALSRQADLVVEVVCGLPVVHKGNKAALPEPTALCEWKGR